MNNNGANHKFQQRLVDSVNHEQDSADDQAEEINYKQGKKNDS